MSLSRYPEAVDIRRTATLADRRSRAWWLWPALVVIAAVVGGWGSSSAPAIYAQMEKPGWAPPASVFGPVWSVLYVLMAIAAVRVARLAPSPARTRALAVFALQLIANALWSWAFFAWQDGALSMAVLVALWISVAASAVLFGQLDRIAGVLMLPVLAWVTFAGFLNHAVWRLNPSLLS